MRRFSSSFCPVSSSVNRYLDELGEDEARQDWEEYTERARCKCGRFFQRTTSQMERAENMQTRCPACIRKVWERNGAA